jgi:hypothetical protein
VLPVFDVRVGALESDEQQYADGGVVLAAGVSGSVVSGVFPDDALAVDDPVVLPRCAFGG